MRGAGGAMKRRTERTATKSSGARNDAGG